MPYEINGTKVTVDASSFTEQEADELTAKLRSMDKITNIVVTNQNLKGIKTLGAVTPYSKEKMLKFFDAQCVAMNAENLDMTMSLDMGVEIRVRYNYTTGKIKYSGLRKWAFKYAMGKKYKLHHKLFNIWGILTKKIDLEKLTLEKAWNTMPAGHFHPEAFAAIGEEHEVLSIR